MTHSPYGPITAWLHSNPDLGSMITRHLKLKTTPQAFNVKEVCRLVLYLNLEGVKRLKL